MKRVLAAVAVIVCGTMAMPAQSGPKPCEDLKAEIAKKLDAKGVTNYSLTIVEKGKEGDGKVVGSCGGGTNSILYARTAVEAKPKAEPKKK